MNKQKALKFTSERIESISRTIYGNESERKAKRETLEYLEFIKRFLEESDIK